MGVVYEAEDSALARTVAVKTIDLAFAAGAAASSEFERRFFTEARVAARLSHPGILVCHDVGKDEASGKLFIVFEYLKGRTLAERVAEGPMDWRQALGVVVQVARAIHHAHAHGVVHRDLKPANIMLLDPGTSGASAAGAEAVVKIMDFGVARLESLGPRLTKTGQSFGSPLYMSPEQALGQASSARSDIFSLGSVLCTLLLGRPWFEAPSLPEIVARVVHDDRPHLSKLRPELPASLDAVLGMALAKREKDRYVSAAHMADDLEDVLAGKAARHAAGAHDPLASLLDEPPAPERASLPGTAGPTSAARPTLAGDATATLVTTVSRRRWLVPAVAVLVLAVLAAGALVSWRGPSGLDPADVPQALVPSERPTAVAESTPSPLAPETSPSTIPSAPPAVVRPAPTPTAPAVRPRSPAPGTAAAVVESPSSSSAPPASRIRLTVDHPFENGRLIAWIDGVLVYETKLQASASKRIVAFKVREGHVETLLDVAPGPHQVRVEVTWEQDRRVSTKVVDVAPGATGLLEVRVGRMSKDLNLAWSRLVKD
jgi:hypothetical protein